MKKSFYFYTSIALTIILGLVIGNYIFGWTTPTANPPASNLAAPINTGSTAQSKSGYLAVGTTTTPTYPLEVGNQLRVWGQLISKIASGTAPFVVDSPTKVANLNADLLDNYDSADLLGGSVEIPVNAATYFYNGGNPYYCKKKVVSAAGFVTFSNINENNECDPNKFCSSGICVSGSNNVYCDEDNDTHYTIAAVASSSNCPSGRYRYNQAGDDCDDNCSQCYPGSLFATLSPDGHDQDCNGVIDNFTSQYFLYLTASTYTGNLGGRSGSDNKCNVDSNKPPTCTDAGFAFVSVASGDTISAFPSTKNINTASPWYWVKGNTTSPAATSWTDLLDGTISTSASSVGYSSTYPYWTGATATGGLATEHCQSWTSDTSTLYGSCGKSTYTNTGWLSASSYNCNSKGVVIICTCPNIGYR